MVEEEKEKPLNADWEKIEKAIHDIHKILYTDDMTLLEIDLIVNTIWTNSQKDKVVQLALSEMLIGLRKDIDSQIKDTKKGKSKKEERAPGVG